MIINLILEIKRALSRHWNIKQKFNTFHLFGLNGNWLILMN